MVSRWWCNVMVDGSVACNKVKVSLTRRWSGTALARLFRLAAKGEHLLHQGFCPLAGRNDLLEIAPRLTVLWYIVECELRIAENDGQNVVEIMGNATRQGTNSLHFLGLA